MDAGHLSKTKHDHCRKKNIQRLVGKKGTNLS